MPAVTPDNPLALPRIEPPAPERARRAVLRRTVAPRGLEGEGFPVRRAFAGATYAELDPFIHMDEMGEVDYAPGEPKGTPWHPHRGFETVTYLLEGIFEHADSIGGGGVIRDGATQWMTAGAGILHIERPPEHLVVSGGLFHGFQLWVNLPARDKMVAPRYQDIEAEQVKLASSPDGGALVRVIAGEVAGLRGPGITHTPIALVHATLQPGARLELPWDPAFNCLVYAFAGSGAVGPEATALGAGQLAVLGPGEVVELVADPEQSSRHGTFEALILGGTPLREPVAAYGPFVMNTEAEIRQAFEDFEAGRLGTIPAERA
jgi:quercetin 2,3-dioxygenase